MRDAPFFVIEHGTVDIVEHRLEEDVWFARMDGGTFIGDVSMFTGEPTLAAGVDLDDGQHVVARTLLVATGAQWRTIEAEGIERFTGAGVHHVATATSVLRCEGEDVVVVGGGNSAGQAAVHLSHQARSVRMVVRRDCVAPTMSRYLLDRSMSSRSARRTATSVLRSPCSKSNPMLRSVASDTAAMTSAAEIRS